jgi:AcrR family transcriptional regulator
MGMTKTEIIDAAFKVWGREFYLYTSLSQVARELGVSKPALYRHFRNKQALLDAMAGRFFDDFAAWIRPVCATAMQNGDSGAVIAAIIRSSAEYYARNVDMYIFSLVKTYDGRTGPLSAGEQLRARGVDMGEMHRLIKQDYSFQPLIMGLLFATLIFCMAHFHKREKSFEQTPSEAAIADVIASANAIVESGLGFSRGEIDALDYAALERRVAGTVGGIEDDPLLRAVAEAVAEAGPWEASMEQVARRSGLSKSSLYGHFKNKQDMLRQLFMTEFTRIIGFARQGIELSALVPEQLYLGIFSITAYLRSRPQILVAIDWIRTRRLDLDGDEQPGIGGEARRCAEEDEDMPGIFSLFAEIAIKPLQWGGGGDDEDKRIRRASHWILFLIINLLMQKPPKTAGAMGDVPDGDIRILYRFLTLGIKGFKL